MIDGTNEVLQIGSDYNWVTVPMQESGTVKLYIKDGNNSVQNVQFGGAFYDPDHPTRHIVVVDEDDDDFNDVSPTLTVSGANQ